MTKIEDILKELKEVVYIGEEGGMVTNGDISQEEAYKRMKARWAEDCGKEEADDMFSEWIHLDDVQRAYLHIATKEDKGFHGEDVDWFISLADESPYMVWAYFD